MSATRKPIASSANNILLVGDARFLILMYTLIQATFISAKPLICRRPVWICAQNSIKAGPGAVLSSDSFAEHRHNLTYLDLSGMQFTHLPSNVFNGLDHLTSLLLHHNKLTKLDPNIFSGLTMVKSLYLSNNNIVLPRGIFDDLIELEFIRIEKNSLESLPVDLFQNNHNLTYIWLCQNELTTLPSGLLHGLYKLEKFHAELNKIESIPAEFFRDNTMLTQMILADNSLVTLPDDIFKNLHWMRRVDFSNNQLTSVPSFSGMERMHTLKLQNNVLSDLQGDLLEGCIGLETLYLESNNITSLPYDIFQGIGQLHVLNLRGNDELRFLPRTIFDGLNAFTDVGLGRAHCPCGSSKDCILMPHIRENCFRIMHEMNKHGEL